MTVTHLDAAWQPAGTSTVVKVEHDPVITPAGEFRFSIISHEARLADQRLICTVHLPVDREAIRFETTAQVVPATGQWRATFHASGLPTTTLRGETLRHPVPIPPHMLELYAVPRTSQP
jgi:hypothetical protein